MKKLGVGIIGCGVILSVHLDSILAFEDAELMMVCDLKEGLARRIGDENGCRWTTDYMDVLKVEAIDIVHILTPHFLHTPMAVEALNHGKHVVLEKPVGISSAELKELQKVADNRKLTVGVTLQNRFNPTTVKMKEVAESGLLGRLIAAKGILTWSRKDGYYQDSDWRGKLATEGGGLMINQAIHTLDLMEYIGGSIDKLEAVVSNMAHADIEVEDTAMIGLQYENGAFGNFFGTNNYGDNSSVEMGFVFEQGRLELRDNQLSRITDEGTEVIAWDKAKDGQKSYWGVSHQLILRDIYDSIHEDREPKVTLADGIRATELVMLCYGR